MLPLKYMIPDIVKLLPVLNFAVEELRSVND